MVTIEHSLTYDVNAVTWEPINLPDDGMESRLKNAWFQLGIEGFLPYIFWERYNPYRELTSDEFLEMFNDGAGSYLFQWNHAGETIGYLWFDHIVAGHKAHVGIAMLRQHWGANTPLLIERFRPEFHDMFKVPYLFALTPWRTARAMLAKTRFELLTTVDHYTPLTRTGTVWVYRSVEGTLCQVEAAAAAEPAD